MTQKSYAKHVTTILGAGVVLVGFFFVLVVHHNDMPNRVERQRGALLGTGSSVAERIKPVAQVDIASAKTQKEPVKSAAAASPAARDGQQVYQATCVACHDAGIAGAPKFGDKGQWAKRIAKGVAALYASSLNGVQSGAGVMPAKGGNPGLSDAEVKSAVDYMVARSK